MEQQVTANEQALHAKALHDRCIVFDGLIISNWSRELFLDMRRGGLTAANCTCGVWEGFQATIDNVLKLTRLVDESSDLTLLVRGVEDIERAKAANKTGIILGLQNTSAFEGNIGYVSIFRQLGVGIAQLTYNTQNLVGSGCYESRDSGLTDFGREIVSEMNRVGILCDLSHVGARTSRDAISASASPVTYSHVLPLGLKQHARNKSDEDLRFLADRGGHIGVTMFTPFLKNGSNSTVDDYVEAIDYVVNVVGEDCVGIGTDFTQDQTQEFFDWICTDHGVGRRLVQFGEIKNPAGFETIGDFPALTWAMHRAGWPDTRIEKVLGANWTRILREVWPGTGGDGLLAIGDGAGSEAAATHPAGAWRR